MRELECDKPGSLMIEAIKLLKEDPRGINQISMEECIPHAWLRLLENGDTKAPSVNRIEYLIDRLNTFKANNNK